MANVIDGVRFNFLYVDVYSFGRTWVYPESMIPYSMLRYILAGKAVFFVDGKEVLVHKDQVVYLPMGSQLSCHALEDNFSFISVRFTTSVHFEGGDFLTDYYHVPTVMEGENEKQFFEEMYHWVKTDSPARMYFVRGYLELLIGSLIHRMNKDGNYEMSDMKSEDYNLEEVRRRIQKTNNRVDPRIQVVIDYLVLHPTEKYSLERMAEMAELSLSRFRQLFKEQVGKSPSEYLQELRLTTAARKLLISSENVSDIGYSVGYEDPNYFIRRFKAAFGLTPKQYRENAKE